MAQQALETFSCEVNGAPVLVTKGEVFADSHAVVKVDQGRGILFRPLDVDEPSREKPVRPGKAAK